MNGWERKLLEVAGLLMIGEGVTVLLRPRGYASLGQEPPSPRPVRVLAGWFHDHPGAARAVAAAEVGLGLWLATRRLPE